jgi:hypothetical protein
VTYDTNALVEQQVANYINSPYAKNVGISSAYPIPTSEAFGGGYAFDGKTLILELHYYTLLIDTTAAILVEIDGTRHYKKYTHRVSQYLSNSTTGVLLLANMLGSVTEY